MTAYYNEFDPFAAAWLRELIKANLIAPGDVDERSIEDVLPIELRGYTQCHFFAGIGVWSYALRRAGWSDDRPVWTGSCPCQPFSSAGGQSGFDDPRHLWPHFERLIAECRPPIVVGEQVASKAADVWIDLVQTDMEALGYAFGAVPFPSASVGAPHIRDRTFWLGHADGEGPQGHARDGGTTGRSGSSRPIASPSVFDGLEDPAPQRLQGWPITGWQPEAQRGGLLPAGSGDDADGLADTTGGRQSRGVWECGSPERSTGEAGGHGAVIGLADADGGQRNGQPILRGIERDGPDAGRSQGGGKPEPHGDDVRLDNPASTRHVGALGEPKSDPRDEAWMRLPYTGRENGGLADADGGNASAERQQRGGEQRFEPEDSGIGDNDRPGPINGFWRDADWLFCRDGKWRPVEPSTFPLANGSSARVGRLRGYGNAINAKAAQVFIETVMNIIQPDSLFDKGPSLKIVKITIGQT